MPNHITIMGRLVRDPELRHTQSGTPVANFSLAVDRDFKGQDGMGNLVGLFLPIRAKERF